MAKVDSIGIITNSRPRKLFNCLTTIAVEFKRDVSVKRVIVCDDSKSYLMSHANRKITHLINSKYGTKFEYWGTREKYLYLNCFIDKYSLDSKVTKITFGVNSQANFTAGSNRNWLLLLTKKNKVLSLDDDVSYNLINTSRTSDILKISSSLKEFRTDRFRSREETLEYYNHHSKTSPINYFSEFIGKTSTELKEVFRNPIISNVSPNLKAVLSSDVGKIAFVYPGLLGYNPSSPIKSLLSSNIKTHNKLTTNQKDFLAYQKSQESLRVSKEFLLSDSYNAAISGYYGFDNNLLLPPFVPYGRGEDVISNFINKKYNGELLLAYLPLAYLHTSKPPLNPNLFNSQSRWNSVPTYLIVCSIIDLVSKLQTVTFGHNLSLQLGENFIEIAQKPDKYLTDLLIHFYISITSANIAKLEQNLQQFSEAPPFWSAVIKSLIAQKKRELSSETIHLLSDNWGTNTDWKIKLKEFKKYMTDLGNILQYWMVIMKAAND